MTSTLDRDKLLRAVRRQGALTLSNLKDVATHGADTGWQGFTYTTDCARFFLRHAEEIWELAVEAAEDQGVNVATMIGEFGRKDMADSWDGFCNLMAWFALEEMANYAIDKVDTD